VLHQGHGGPRPQSGPVQERSRQRDSAQHGVGAVLQVDPAGRAGEQAGADLPGPAGYVSLRGPNPPSRSTRRRLRRPFPRAPAEGACWVRQIGGPTLHTVPPEIDYGEMWVRFEWRGGNVRHSAVQQRHTRRRRSHPVAGGATAAGEWWIGTRGMTLGRPAGTLGGIPPKGRPRVDSNPRPPSVRERAVRNLALAVHCSAGGGPCRSRGLEVNHRGVIVLVSRLRPCPAPRPASRATAWTTPLGEAGEDMSGQT
jgi:hypothetical protein